MIRKDDILNCDGIGPFKPEELYKRRSDFQRINLERGKHPKDVVDRVMKHEDKAYNANLLDLKQFEKIGDRAILAPCHRSQIPWIKPCFESYKKTGYFVLMAYDNPFFRSTKTEQLLPSSEVMALPDAVVMKHQTYLRSVGASHLWNMLYGLKLLKGWGFTYVLNINGDCLLEKPENVGQVFDMLDGYDIHALSWEPDSRYCGTMGIVAKIDLLIEFFYSYLHTFTMGYGTTEGRLWRFVEEKKLRVVPVKNCPERYRLPSQESDWYKILGFRHLHAEHKVRHRDRLEPLEEKHYDCSNDYAYLGARAKNTLVKYWETGDKKHLEAWWG